MQEAKNKFLIVISGPTGIGKTELALRLNQELQTSIISADSRQIYREMNIGTAKPNPLEIKEGNIKLVDHVSVSENYSAGKFEEEALEQIDIDFQNKDYSILCGGTGLYIKAVLEGLDKFPQVNPLVLKNLNDDLHDKGLEKLQEELKSKDPVYFNSIDVHNPRRILRALSIIRSTDKSFSSFQNQEKNPRPFIPIHFILQMDRQKLYDRINVRVLKMIEKGLVDEVKSLLVHRDLRALDTVGYTEIFKHLNGEWTLEKAINEIQKNSRRYAKRQMTWGRGQTKGEFFEAGDFEGIMRRIINYNL